MAVMKPMGLHLIHRLALLYLLPLLLSTVSESGAATMNDYGMFPPFLAHSIPPLVMLNADKSHKLYYQAYNDATDLNGDGRLEIGYTHTIDYYGYFDSYKCYSYDSSSAHFIPVATTFDKFCSGRTLWSGNVLNWITMSRMDVVRKVLFGGARSTDTATSTVLERAQIPMDAHSWGKELTGRLCSNGATYTGNCSVTGDCLSGYSCVDVQSAGKYLTPYATSDAPASCTSSAVTTSQTGKILVARYRHDSLKSCGVTNTQAMVNTYEPAALFNPVPTAGANSVAISADTSALVTYVSGFDDASLDPARDYADNYNILATTVITVAASDAGNWQFAIDGNDDVELQIDGAIVAQALGCHGPSGGQGNRGTKKLTAGDHLLVARHFAQRGGEGVLVWYKKPEDSTWRFVNSANLAIRAPTIASGNECAIRTAAFVMTGIPTVGATVVSGTSRQNLFCNTTPSGSDAPLLRVVANVPNRIGDWSAKERPECNDFGHGADYPFAAAPVDYTVRVKVCDGTAGLETNCKRYGAGTKPTGLLQKYGEGDGGKFCSRSYSKSCSTSAGDSSDCSPEEGVCVYKSPIYFGMIGGSFMKNTSGGVLRKNLGSMLDEVNVVDGTFNRSFPGIINAYTNLRMVGYDSDFTWQGEGGGSCGWIESRSMQEGECRNWGNPLGEMLYETLRYFAGKGTPTPDFEYSSTYDSDTVADGGLSLPHPSWGYKKGSATYQPYEVFPSCSKPFMLILSDVNPNHDSDQIPGSSFAKEDKTFFTEDALTPQLGLGVQTDGVSLLNTLADTIGITEQVANTTSTGNKWYVGQSSNANYDSLCTAKYIGTLGSVRGLCPEEPTAEGSYYSAALAYYGRTLFNAATGKPNITTYAVAMASPRADFKIKAGSRTVTLVPAGKSVSGCMSVRSACYDNCSGMTYDGAAATPGHGLVIGGCSASAYCPTNQIVNFFVDDVRYDTATTPPTVIYASFRINFEDSEQGADHDMDTIVAYEVCTQAAVNKYGSCVDTLGDKIQVKLSVNYGAGCIDQVLGFVISGTTEDGTYLPVKDGDVPDSETSDTPALIAAMPKVWSKLFSPGSSPADFLKNPLWYAAKWGGFVDGNAPVNQAGYLAKPDRASQWDTDGDGTPDNYYLAVSPLKLEQQLDKALADILKKTASGTAASILNSSEGSGAALLQAFFYPKKSYEHATSLSWSGELINLWYYVDPFFAQSTIREDSDYTSGAHIMDIARDKRIQFDFNDVTSQTTIKRYNFDGTTESAVMNSRLPGGLKSLWTAGALLWNRNITSDPRTIYTTLSSSSPWNFTDFSTSNATVLSPLLHAEGADSAAQTAFAAKIIEYVQGSDVCLDSSSPCTSKSRNRTVDIPVSDTATESHVWKLGDIISSTPRIQGTVPLQSYDQKPPLGYDDSTYKAYYSAAQYGNRGMVYVGGNDGMLHAFKLGKMVIKTLGTQKATLSGSNLGREEWAFIPRHVLPYLKYMALPDYDNNHLYMVDGVSSLLDVSTRTIAARDDYWNEPRTASTWKTVLLGGMGLGGASRNSDSACPAGSAAGTCVKTPLNGQGFSSYFAIDVTDQDFNQDAANALRTPPALLWEFLDPALGYSTSGPAIIRLNAKAAVAPFAPQAAANGRWFAVYASGPTGPIDSASKQFKGKSDQNLRLFVVDLEKGPVVHADPKKNGLWIIDTGIPEAFAGSISNNAVADTEMNDSVNVNLRQDDVLYVGYTKKAADGTWTDGGVLRLVIPDSANPDTMDVSAWKTSLVIDGIGPVTTTVTKLMSKNNLYLFFGTGRYFYPQDDMTSTRRLFMVKEKCYPDVDKGGKYLASDIISNCPNVDATHSAVSPFRISDLTSKNIPDNSAVTNGWFIDLDAGERVVSDTVATVNGAVFYTSYKPVADVCAFGGTSYLWGVKYDTGDALPVSAKIGKVVIQLSTGSFAEMDLSTTLTDRGGRRSKETSDLAFGKISGTGLIMTTAGLTPVKRILHIQDRVK